MLRKLMRWLYGYLYITLKGDYPEHFMNLCESRSIHLWGMECRDGEYFCYVDLKEYKELREIAKKTKTIPYIKQRVGFPFFMKRVRRRKVYFIGILLFCALVYIMSQFLWDISIEGGTRHTPEELLRYLSTTGVYSGCRIKDIDCPLIEENIRRDFTDIGWVSAQIKGTRLIVNIVETEVPVLVTDKKNTKLTYAHIVAQKDGIISSMIVRSGVPKVNQGSVVKKGDVLVSGIIPVIGDDGNVITNKKVLADADIQIKTFEDYAYEFPMEFEYKQYTEKKEKGYSLELWSKKIFSVSPSNSYKHYDIINDVKTLKLVRNFYLPIRITKTTVYQYNLRKDVYTESEAMEKANKALLRYLEVLKRNGATIIENQVDTTIKDGICCSNGKIILEQPAWNYHKINDSEWRIIETDERNGNDS